MPAGAWKTSGSYSGTNWKYPEATRVQDGWAAIYSAGSQDPLKLTQFAFGVTAAPLGFELRVRGSRGCWNVDPDDRVVAQLAFNGALVGASKELVIPTTDGSVTAGGAADLWSVPASILMVNATSFGVWIWKKSSTAGREFRLDLVEMRVTT